MAEASWLDREELKVLRIGLPPYLSMRCSTGLLKNLHAAYPEISFSICETYTGDMERMLLGNQLQIVVTNEPVQIEGGDAYPFGKAIPILIYLRKNSPAAKYGYIKDGVQFLDPVYLQETRHISTLYSYAKEGITSAVGPRDSEAEAADQDMHLIYRIPETYRWSRVRSQICVLPETKRLLPRPLIDIIKKSLVYDEGADLDPPT